ncbi:Crp/Fnr family transcriptional regulator [Rubrivirga sp.]|uniref:Crp/Fnr family transcriptional regulator n=1 Tax=Rubrivirga sp. TaxID=1885344 RepID=UPI003C77F1CC
MPLDTPDSFRPWLAAVVPLSDDEWAAVAERLVPVRLEAGETLAIEGEVRRWVGFVREGALRYSVLRDGTDHVTAFDFEGDVAGDLSGFFDGAPASQTITAVEPSALDVLTHDAFAALVHQVPSLAAVRGAVAGMLFDGARARAAELQQFSAEDRYRRLLARSPRVVQRVPLYHVASYLGVTPEALSRIRRRVAGG